MNSWPDKIDHPNYPHKTDRAWYHDFVCSVVSKSRGPAPRNEGLPNHEQERGQPDLFVSRAAQSSSIKIGPDAVALYFRLPALLLTIASLGCINSAST